MCGTGSVSVQQHWGRVRQSLDPAVRGGCPLTSKGWSHGEVMVLHPEQRPRFSRPDLGHIEVLFIQVTAKKQKWVLWSAKAPGENGRMEGSSQCPPVQHFFFILIHTRRQKARESPHHPYPHKDVHWRTGPSRTFLGADSVP